MSEWPFVEYGTLSSSDRSAFSMGPFGSRITKENYVDSGVPVVRGVNLSRGIFADKDFVFVETQKADELISANVAPGDLIFTHRGTIGQVSMVPRKPQFQRYIIGSSQVKTRLDESIAIPEFYYYWFTSPEGQRSILANTSTVGVPGIATPLSSIKGLRVPLPPLSTQRAVASVLGALDDKITVNDRIVKTSVQLAQAIFDSSWPEMSTKVDEVATVLDGPHATPRKVAEGPWFLSISSLKSGVLDLDESVSMAEEDFSRWTRRVQPHEGDVLFSYETRLGDAALMVPRIRASVGRRMAVLRPKSPETSGALLLHSYLSSTFHRQIRERAVHGATVDRIPLAELPSWQLPLPAPKDRARYSEVLTGIHRRIAASLLEKGTLARLRDNLLPELMSGRLRVKDAEKVVGEAV